ncbi:hypothetical protein [Algibacter sp. 2305UL17-15]|uniref:hypothetical protein n=1 Tax=Algibacter sp. 2305UL17-15 TaxID=3231268 RepID=UPI00345ABE0E
MKTKKIIVLSGLVLCLLSLSSFKSTENTDEIISDALVQEGFIVYATFDGKEDYGYNFITTDKEGEEHTLTFQKVEDAVLKTFDLNSDAFVNTKFKITFNRDVKVSKDEHGNEDEDEVNTITMLEKL